MKGFLSLQGILLIGVVLFLFGGAIYGVTTAGARCALGVWNPALNYSCDDMMTSIASTFTMPDQNIGKGTMAIVTLRGLEPATLAQYPELTAANEDSFRNQIFVGLIGEIIIFGFLVFLFSKLAFSSDHELGAFLIILLAAFLVLAVVLAMFDNSPDPGFMSFFGDRTPFKGVRTLMAHTEVLTSLIDDSGILPGTMTVSDITNASGGSPG